MTSQSDAQTDLQTSQVKEARRFQPDLSDNRSIWDKVQYTEISATKPIQGKGRPMTDINPTWRMKRMTEMFGPVGLGWGWSIDDRWAEDVGPKRYAYIQLTVWYSLDGGQTKLIAGPHIGGTDMGQGKDEAYKQSVTDAFGKCISMIGVAADVYEGRWDDSKYQNEASAAVEAQRNPDLTPQAIAKSEAELAEKLEAIPDLKALDDLWAGGINARIKEIGTANKEARQRMISAFTAKKNELLALQNDKQEEPPEDGQEQEERQPSIRDLDDRDQEEHMRHIQQEEHAPTLDKPAHPVKSTQDDLTPECILQFKEWVGRKLFAIKDGRELNAFWDSTCAERMNRIEPIDPDTHKEISDLYVKYQKKFASKGGTSFKRVTNQD